ncbi:ExbD/TolR family protein [Candidatus Mycalebacterium sp.]
MSGLDLTPVVDVVFNLLIFFALSLNFTPAVKGIKIKIPEVGSPVGEIKTEKISVSVYADGRIYLDNKQVSRKSLRETLEKSSNKSAIAVIKAEENVAHGTIVDIMSIIKASGYTKLALAARNLKP